MDTPNTPTPVTLRKKMPAEVFIKIWEGEKEVTDTEWNVKKWKGILDVKGTELEGIVKLEEHYSGDVVMFTDIEVVGETHIINGNKLMACLILSNCKIENLCIENSKIHSAYFIKSTVVENIRVIENSNLGYFLVTNAIIGVLKLKNSKVTILRIEKNSKLRKLQLWHSPIQRIRITENSFIDHIFCQFSHKEPTQLLIDESKIGYLDFDDSVCPEFTTLNLSNCKIHTIAFSNFCNYGSIFFSDLKPWVSWEKIIVLRRGNPIELNDKPTLHFTDSDLGKMQFINCNLNLFERFEFYNTKILDVFVAGSEMPGDSKFHLPNNEQNLDKIIEQKRIAFGQFKKIYSTRGDSAGSLHYLAFEMDAYREQLKREKTRLRFSKEWWFTKKAWDNRGERATLWLNKYSTGYGNNWLRGVLMTILMMSICFTIFCWMLGYRFGSDWKKFGELVSYAPYYLNPLRNLDTVSMINENKGEPIEWYARLWDFLSRIIVAYFAYQTIQAFRKLGKSSG